jgi:2C-methyl-D-erythritol 2,4-cyclodiphosphate synthase
VSDEAMNALHDALCEAMVAGDIGELDNILAEEFTLTHMTGYVQSKSETPSRAPSHQHGDSAKPAA